VSLDRQSIESNDFPLALRGYRREAVDARLRAIADEVEVLRAAVTAGASRTLATSAGDQVRAILDAAEQSAAELVSQAEEEARQRADGVAVAAEALRERMEVLDSDLGGLIETLRGGAQGLLPIAPDPEEPEPKAAATPEPAASEPKPAPEPAGPEPVASVQESGPEPGVEPAVVSADEEGARIVALDLALDGKPRDEADRYLAEHFALADRGTLLDEIYASVGT
jgi:vacuolar-type H+-ATPase subunit H